MAGTKIVRHKRLKRLKQLTPECAAFAWQIKGARNVEQPFAIGLLYKWLCWLAHWHLSV
jgi:hypothetical protein